jgi:dihydroneopterin aldolase
MLKSNELIILIRNLRVQTLIGAYEHERSAMRELNLNIELKLYKMGISMSDQLCDTVDYALIAERLSVWMKTQSSHLLEHLAHLAILKILEIDTRISEAAIEIFKPGCIPYADGASVKMSYPRNELSNL